MALRDFSDLVTAVRTELKIPPTDTNAINKIKLDINVIYLDEIVPHKRWLWLTRNLKVIHKAAYGAGTANVITNQLTATLSVTPDVSLGSFKGYKFSTDNFAEIYTVSAHTAGSATITIDSAYIGQTNTALPFKIWKDTVDLPTTAREVIEVIHPYLREPLVGQGFKEFRQTVSNQPRAQAYPAFYNVAEYTDPTPDTDETEADRFRTMRIYPSITSQPVTLNIDYILEATWLSDDGDEPIVPLEDRIVIVYGALARAWGRERNEERAAANDAMYQRKLGRMAGKIEEGFDRPRLTISSNWAAKKRGPRVKGFGYRSGDGTSDAFGSGGGYTIPTYLENTTINGATLTGNMIVNNGITIDGRDVSVDGAALDAHVAASANVHGIGVSSSVVGTATTQTLTNKTIPTMSNMITGAAGFLSEFSGAGNLQASAVTSSQLGFLANAAALASTTLADNQASAADAFTVVSTNSAIIAFYSLSRGSGNSRTGILFITNDGTNADIVELAGDLGTLGVTLTADVSGGNIRIRYTSTSTGTAPVMKYMLLNWAA